MCSTNFIHLILIAHIIYVKCIEVHIQVNTVLQIGGNTIITIGNLSKFVWIRKNVALANMIHVDEHLLRE